MKIKELYVSVFPSLLPNTDLSLSDEQKVRDFYGTENGPASVRLSDFLKADANIRKKVEQARRIDDARRRCLFIGRQLSHAVVAATVWSRDFSLPDCKIVKSYNSMIMLEIIIENNLDIIMRTLRTKRWVWFVARSADMSAVLALVPLDNCNYEDHYLYHRALKAALKKDGLYVTARCCELCFCVAQTYDPNAWYNDDCIPFSLPSKYSKTDEEDW